MNLLQLMDKTNEVAGWRGHGYGQNSNWTLKATIPFVGTKSLLFQAVCFGQTVDAEHVTNIQFSGLKILDELPTNADYKEIEYKGETYYCERPTVETQVTLRCSCADFYFRFMWWNFKNKCLFGNMGKKYIRKTKTRPEVNPKHLPGFCKHLYQLQSYLRVHDYMA